MLAVVRRANGALLERHEPEGSPVSDHAIIAALAVVGFTIQISGLIVLARMLRESQRLTRAVAGLVYQENERTRSLLGRP